MSKEVFGPRGHAPDEGACATDECDLLSPSASGFAEPVSGTTGRRKRLAAGTALLATALALSVDGGLLLPLLLGLSAGLGAWLLVGTLGSGERAARNMTRLAQALAESEASRRSAEEAVKASQRLLATVSHDLRTPLTGLIGMADLLDHSRLSAEQRNYVGGIRQSGQMLSHLVEDLLDFATLEAGQFRLRRVQESPRRLIETVTEMLAPRAHFKGLEIASCVEPNVPEWLDLDPARFRQVLYNVIGNAVKFTQAGGVIVSAGMDGADLLVTVADTGPGMSEADRVRIFDEFVQTGSDESRSGGKGLGLAISSRLVKAFGGSVTVESKLGKGSSFTIRLPVSTSTGIAAPWRSRAMKDATVLLVAPRGPAATAIERTITGFGGQCSAVTDPSEAEAVLSVGQIGERPLTDIIVDHRLERAYVSRLAQQAEALKLRRVLLVNPEERQARISGPYDAWLIRPLREQSLIDVMSGKLHGMEKRGATNDNLPHDSNAWSGTEPSGRLILLGEDDPVNALLVRTALQRAGHAVVCASDFASLLAEICEPGRGLPDLIISDLNMPGGTIGQLFQLLDAYRPERRVPVLVLSGESDPSRLSDASLNGAAQVLSKPVLPQDLVAHVETLLPPPPPSANMRLS